MKKKLLVILGTEPESGGGHQYASTIMDYLAENCCGEIELCAVSHSRYWRKWCRENGIRILDTPWFSFTMQEQRFHLEHPYFSHMYSMYISGTGKMLRKERIDAVLGTFQGIFIPNLGIKAIIPVHDLMHRYEGQFAEVKGEYEGRDLVFASNAKYAWCVMTDSKLGRDQFIESYSGYMKRKRLHVISMPFVVPKHIAECAEEFVEVPEKYIFYPAQFWQHKNHLNLIRAVKILLEDIPDIHVVLAGTEKNNMEPVKRYIAENHLEGNVTIKGFVSNGNITYLYKHAVGMVMPSYFGPTNIPPLEAMALGCPVAVSDKYAMPEQVGDAGLLFNPDSPQEIAECVRKMWCDSTLRQKMISRGYARVNRWTPKELGERLKNILKKV